ncbi:bifunctional DNA-formamidopyrimidine glycosylase/DNA-(apurinic or apyrimidinic site) lyase [Stappia taiwanensis]|uniref:Formamidopyrimidine-DNA glycosylase n=1 Tax=Stappia taiwanensis TaxID=992267 RepID=A0A838XWM1_9HYPH|nr:bifunctional DNA-formamidopyrimidine glycosylase/DNA-(apurinic or apyrimidinic site) lyase [Stappia taiwanensis]MBA4613421.1 bifunctional DNA-formamidopyrimidine glycosylase/DNA-(apurinic or apyrimidinic site) lyase [Stappia taiwanensis]GGF02180.1 formamidopyrimidine-DNA glycosylase [Stappia taiwanensis]
MPELPEVETVRRGLAPVFEGAEIASVSQNRPDLRFPFPEDFAARLTGRQVVSLGRRAKYLLADLDDAAVLVMHLGMSGAFRIETGEGRADAVSPVPDLGAFRVYPPAEARAHDHVVFHLRSPTGQGARVPMRIVYNDPRRFGFMTLIERSAVETHPYFAKLGVEPTGNQLDADLLAARLAGKATSLKAALLDQRVIAGLGNIYVCEALYRSGLSPTRAAGSLVTARGRPTAAAGRLAVAIREVIAEAIAAGGSTLRDHRQADGSLGYFQHSFAVYGREGELCRTPGCTGTIARMVQGGRSTFYCPRCQK